MINFFKKIFIKLVCIFYSESCEKEFCKRFINNMLVKQSKKIRKKIFVQESLYLEGRWHGISTNPEQGYHFKLEFDFYIDKLGKFTGFGVMTQIKIVPDNVIENMEDFLQVFNNNKYTIYNEMDTELLTISGSHHMNIIIVTYESKDSLRYYGTCMLNYENSRDKRLSGDVLGSRVENEIKTKSKIFLIKKAP